MGWNPYAYRFSAVHAPRSAPSKTARTLENVRQKNISRLLNHPSVLLLEFCNSIWNSYLMSWLLFQHVFHNSIACCLRLVEIIQSNAVVFFREKANFMNWVVSTKRGWGSNSRELHVKALHRAELPVWCTIFVGHAVFVYFFEVDSGASATQPPTG